MNKSSRRCLKTAKILIIGNIANNGYLLGEILRSRGVEADVAVFDYYHINACPEWESATKLPDTLNENFPIWLLNKDIVSQRPDWFFQGPIIDVLDAIVEKDKLSKFKLNLCRDEVIRFENTEYIAKKNVHISYMKNSTILKYIVNILQYPSILKKRTHSLIKRHLITKNSLPNVPIPMKPEDLLIYSSIINRLRKAFEKYDLVIGFAIDGIYPLLAERSYIAVEHGTIRTLPFEESIQGRLTNATYCNAKHVLVTNCDNNVAAEKMGLRFFDPDQEKKHEEDQNILNGISEFTFIPHPISEWYLPNLEHCKQIRSEFDIPHDSFLIFHPTRQCWMPDVRNTNLEKGNDIFFKGVAKAIANTDRNIYILAIEFGQTVQKSKDLCKQLGIDHYVKWCTPMIHKRMMDVIASSDIVADQFWNASFGGIPPKAFLLSKPCLCKFDTAIHEWCFQSLPPFLSSENSEVIAKEIIQLIENPDLCSSIGKLGNEWYINNYSNDKLFSRLECVIERIGLG